jgi:hypothetical protein
LGKPEEMEEKDPTTFNNPGDLNNRKRLSIKKKENLVVKILATKFFTKSADELGSGEEIILNPIMRDLIINGYAYRYHMQVGKGKRRKQRKKEVKAEVVEGIGEN